MGSGCSVDLTAGSRAATCNSRRGDSTGRRGHLPWVSRKRGPLMASSRSHLIFLSLAVLAAALFILGAPPALAPERDPVCVPASVEKVEVIEEPRDPAQRALTQ